MDISFKINGTSMTRKVSPTKRLIDFLRNDLGITSVKEGCSEGECGACTVILDGKAVTSCTVFTGQIDGTEIVSIEGLAPSGDLDRLQEAFVRNGAIQCGFCTPGMILSCKALLMENPHPTSWEIRRAIEGNLCRCTGYEKIVKAVEELVRWDNTERPER
ncbi:(2Fe-2S)-binding protein [Fretibacterium sp. OH1220_COT-178]|uniref:(2Fe-2S)-binding protein n=1 Tax=Fretibacterium sp. OH1220_COT-178 TaxID=2491047 RepID=UPI000F5ED64C|nr:(2Fe-2S)-binding protein [Fretibacterium sp. OH1220_COT-178]RRD65424.1 (2Fe-2S)-binding protein [Fretibacterium sp. OH1220_COT-178]